MCLSLSPKDEWLCNQVLVSESQWVENLISPRKTATDLS
jgi:hypothetical protein